MHDRWWPARQRPRGCWCCGLSRVLVDGMGFTLVAGSGGGRFVSVPVGRAAPSCSPRTGAVCGGIRPASAVLLRLPTGLLALVDQGRQLRPQVWWSCRGRLLSYIASWCAGFQAEV